MKRLVEFPEEGLFSHLSRAIAPRIARSCGLITVLALLMAPGQARAAFHLWSINEIYSSGNGSVQFVEFTTASGSQQFLQSQTVTAFNFNSSLSVTFTFPSNLPGDSANKSFIIATPGFGSIPGGVTPDYVFTTAPFLFSGSGSLSFSGGDSITYANLPTDGRGSLVRSGGSMVFAAANSPRNFNDQIGSVPEPNVMAILGLGVLGAAFVVHRLRREH